LGHGPAFCEQKGTTAEGSRAADLPSRFLKLCTEAVVSVRATWKTE
jgi:hypothetical protein